MYIITSLFRTSLLNISYSSFKVSENYWALTNNMICWGAQNMRLIDGWFHSWTESHSTMPYLQILKMEIVSGDYIPRIWWTREQFIAQFTKFLCSYFARVRPCIALVGEHFLLSLMSFFLQIIHRASQNMSSKLCCRTDWPRRSLAAIRRKKFTVSTAAWSPGCYGNFSFVHGYEMT